MRSLAKSNRPIDRALLKYGFSRFSLYILEYCTSENVLEREQYYLDVVRRLTMCKPKQWKPASELSIESVKHPAYPWS